MKAAMTNEVKKQHRRIEIKFTRKDPAFDQKDHRGDNCDDG